MLDVGDGNLVYWEVCGNPAGKPALVVHGGPASGCGTGARQYSDLGGLLVTAWEPAKAWPDAELTVVDAAGHLGGPATSRAVPAALGRFARRDRDALALSALDGVGLAP
jgi:hypothetical protein